MLRRNSPVVKSVESVLRLEGSKGRLTEADTPTIRLVATPSGLSSAHLHHPPIFTGRMPFLLSNQQCQSTEGSRYKLREYIFFLFFWLNISF